MSLEPGDMQFLNNHVIYHARTAFTDGESEAESRLLYRLWLSMPNSRALPEGHEVLWGRIEAGSLRGGIGQVAG
jgi:TfdA family taurine catabolism dioxygenase TauD